MFTGARCCKYLSGTILMFEIITWENNSLDTSNFLISNFEPKIFTCVGVHNVFDGLWKVYLRNIIITKAYQNINCFSKSFNF